MEWFEIAKTGADIGFIVLCAGFVLWQIKDMYDNKKKKDSSVSKRVVEMEDKRQRRYDELLDGTLDALHKGKIKKTALLSFYSLFLKPVMSFITSPAIISPATEGVNEVLPG